MSRYKYTNINKKNKKKYYETTIYKKVEEKNSDSYFIAQEGDRCDNLANRFYGDSTLWWFIAKVNNLTTMNIPAGTSLRIPSTTQDAEGY
jgi:nucleoid-associated protein YgaU|tara:strand:- start:562 stop:831 length:270 start_codon:yes stop_codon:yes gene_type:complete